jgi:hypothetical protein
LPLRLLTTAAAAAKAGSGISGPGLRRPLITMTSPPNSGAPPNTELRDRIPR